MRHLMLSLALALLCMSESSFADVYKYVDADGNIHFTDSPLQSDSYRLEWKRTSQRFIREKDKRLIATGRRKNPLPRSILSVAPKTLALRRKHYSRLIETTATRFRLHPELLHAVIRAESAYNPTAVSSAGAIGLMQLMPGTAARYRVSDSYDPTENVRAGAQYLRFLLDTFDHDLRLALAGYNAGENAVIKYGNRIPPYPETQTYVRKVLQYLWAERTSAGF